MPEKGECIDGHAKAATTASISHRKRTNNSLFFKKYWAFIFLCLQNMDSKQLQFMELGN